MSGVGTPLRVEEICDSNLDWGQDQEIVDGYLKRNPDVHLDPAGPVVGKVLVRANRLTGVAGTRPASFCLRDTNP